MPMHEIYIQLPAWPNGPLMFQGMSIAEAIEKHGYVPPVVVKAPTAKASNGFASEDLFQAAAFQWTWNEFPAFRRTFFHVPNEGKKHIVIAKKDEAKGLLSGVYDIIFMVPGFVVELKQPGNDLSENQKKFKVAMDRFGKPTYTCWYMEDYQAIVSNEFAKVKI